ncbi:Xaa-Pro peptidase family protein [Halorussus gelatinilyticus]|uniref:Xaa-Pro peptidase family protein n=1 Tax=Halorussus gelatinilyticus TaxID=2937524 RepID=A0A8U0IIF6_9EURY|nr:Xaa-Pro peptidase family protein [Halorussus gelatinilyticus]UPW00475.1 Xaa-Pro peptidase family protein [Halorussus gelatinilyticus]
MNPDLSPLADALREADADGYLLDASSEESDQLYLSGFDAPDPFVTLYTPDGTHLLVSGLEYGRATEESSADSVARLSEYGYQERVAEYGRTEGTHRVVAAFLDDRGVASVAAPERFPLGTADDLREQGVAVEVLDEDVVTEIRAVKTDEEIDHVHAAQRANEAAMRAAEDLLEAATVEDGVLYHDGEELTSERVKEEIEVTLLRHGCALDETIVAYGADAAGPHNRGSGPLRADETIVIDIFPRDKATKYHGDMTRTFVKGEANEEIRRRYDDTYDAFEAALDAVEPGATGKEVHDAVCDLYEDRGYDTLRSDPSAETGFIHSTGHGIGLDVHEQPSVSPDGGELKPGHVVTIEPGLYDPDVGGIRIEDLVVVTEDGYENLTNYPIRLELE